MKYTICSICNQLKPCSVSYWYEEENEQEVRRQRAVCSECDALM